MADDPRRNSDGILGRFAKDVDAFLSGAQKELWLVFLDEPDASSREEPPVKVQDPPLASRTLRNMTRPEAQQVRAITVDYLKLTIQAEVSEVKLELIDVDRLRVDIDIYKLEGEFSRDRRNDLELTLIRALSVQGFQVKQIAFVVYKVPKPHS